MSTDSRHFFPIPKFLKQPYQLLARKLLAKDTGARESTPSSPVPGVTPLAKGLAAVGVIEYRVSFATNKTRADINELSLKPIVLKSFLEGPLKGYYVHPQAEVIVDFEHNNQATLQLAANPGKVLNKNVVVFVVPTIHVAGTNAKLSN